MKINLIFCVFLQLRLNILIEESAGSLSGVGTAVSIGRMLLNTFTTNEVTQKDLTAAEELVRGLTFDKYHEKISCQILTKIKLSDFETVVGRIASRHQIPVDIQGAILDGQYVETNKALVREFKFEKGAPGRVLYGRTITLKREDSTIDLAYSFFYLEFKLSPKRIEENTKKRFLGIVIGSKRVVRFEERNLSDKEKDHIFDFYRNKALKGFREEYPALEASGRDEL